MSECDAVGWDLARIVTLVVILRHPVRPSAGRMTGSGGVSSTPRLRS